MKVLVTGGSGFIGSHLVDKLVERGHQVRVLDQKVPHRADVDFLEGDILSLSDMERAVRGSDVFYHLAGFSNIDLVKDDPLQTMKLSVMGTAHALEAARRERIGRFIFASSIYVYEQRGHLYTTGKIAGERMCADYSTLYGLPYTILRLATAFGPRSRDADVISIFVRRAMEGKPLVVRGNGMQRRNFLYVEDMADGLCAALDREAANKTYPLAGRKPVSIVELAETVSHLFENRVEVMFEAGREDDHVGEGYSPEASMDGLKWEPRTSLEDGIRKYVEWYRENRVKAEA